MIFARPFIPDLAKKPAKKRIPAYRMSYSKMMTLPVAYHQLVTEPSSGFINSTFVSTGCARFPAC